MTQDSDGVNEVLDGGLRVALTVAGQLGERLARQREQAAREAQAANESEARALQDRLSAERAAARAQLVPVKDDAWWDKATTAQISDAIRVAATWQGVDPQAAAAVEVIRRQVKERFGVDVDQLRPDTTRVQAADPEQTSTRQNRRAETVEVAQAVADDDRAQAATKQKAAAPAYDSRERREQRATDLTHAGVEPDVVKAATLADTSQARPPVDAVSTPAAVATARPVRPPVQEKQVQLGR